MHNFDTSKIAGRVVRQPNHRYKRDGTKSYVHALLKYNITPTKAGPYFMGAERQHQSKFGKTKSRVGGRHALQNTLMKKKPGHVNDSTSDQVTATDVQNDSEYLCPVTIGTPGQKFMLDFDTGSADLWVWSTELPKSLLAQYGKDHTVFDYKHSRTFRFAHGEKWQIQYGDASTAEGNVGFDQVKIGDITIKQQAVELADELSSQFAQSIGDGLLGLAFGNINTVTPVRVATPVENMIAQHDIPANCELFTAYLGSYKDSNEADKGESFYTFGHIDEQALSMARVGLNQIHYAPIDNSNGFWQFASTSAHVNGNVIHLGASNSAIADTGTTLALVSDELCEAIYSQISGAQYNQDVQGYIFPANTSASGLPTVQVKVGDNFYDIQKEDLAYADAGNGYVYGGVQSRGDLPFDILGDTFLKGVYAIFDVGKMRFGAVQRTEKFQNISTKIAAENKKEAEAEAQAPTPAAQDGAQKPL